MKNNEPIKVITDTENRRKLEFFKQDNGLYGFKYYEFYQACGWRYISSETDYTKDCIEFEFDITLDSEQEEETATENENQEENNMGTNKTTSIKFFYNGIKVNGERALIKCFYSIDNRRDGQNGVTISARDYGSQLPGDIFSVCNESDGREDYFEVDSAFLDEFHPLYKFARFAAIKAEIRHIERYINSYSGVARETQLERLESYKAELDTLPKGNPTTADVEAVHTMRAEAKATRVSAELAEQKAKVAKCQQQIDDGRAYIEAVAAEHPIKEGEPVVTIEWSEHPAFYSWEDGGLKLSVSAAEIVLKHYDIERAQENERKNKGGYDKTAFRIDYTDKNGEPFTYAGRYVLGDNDGGMIAHIRAFSESKRNPGYFHDEEGAEQIEAFANMLQSYITPARIMSVSFAPWVEQAVKGKRQNNVIDFTAWKNRRTQPID